MAAAISYYVLFSVFPLLILLLSLFRLFFEDTYLKRRVIETVIEMIPFSGSKDNIVVEAIQQIAAIRGRTFGLLSLVVMAWYGQQHVRCDSSLDQRSL